MSLGPMPSQTVGPYFAIGLPWEAGPFAVPAGTSGAISIWGFVLDGAGEPVPDALIETWQADPPASDDFRGFARTPTAADGRYELVTRKPGGATPFVDVSVFGRGMLHRSVTRIYFADEPGANAADPILASVPEARRATLLAEPVEGGYRFDIRLQGPDETVFFAI